MPVTFFIVVCVFDCFEIIVLKAKPKQKDVAISKMNKDVFFICLNVSSRSRFAVSACRYGFKSVASSGSGCFVSLNLILSLLQCMLMSIYSSAGNPEN